MAIDATFKLFYCLKMTFHWGNQLCKGFPDHWSLVLKAMCICVICPDLAPLQSFIRAIHFSSLCHVRRFGRERDIFIFGGSLFPTKSLPVKGDSTFTFVLYTLFHAILSMPNPSAIKVCAYLPIWPCNNLFLEPCCYAGVSWLCHVRDLGGDLANSCWWAALGLMGPVSLQIKDKAACTLTSHNFSFVVGDDISSKKDNLTVCLAPQQDLNGIPKCWIWPNYQGLTNILAADL